MAAKSTPKLVQKSSPSGTAEVSIDTTSFDLMDKGDRAHLDALLRIGKSDDYPEPRWIR